MMVGKKQQGFTLIEIILTMVIMGILAVAGVSSMGRFLQASTLDAATRALQSDLRYAQMLAQTTGESYGFRATSATQYEVYNVSTGNIAVSPYDQKPLQVDFSNIHTGIAFSETNYPAYDVTFDKLGRPSAALSIQIYDMDNLVTQSVAVASGSGLISRN